LADTADFPVVLITIWFAWACDQRVIDRLKKEALRPQTEVLVRGKKRASGDFSGCAGRKVLAELGRLQAGRAQLWRKGLCIWCCVGNIGVGVSLFQ